jgi:SAM-dependent methyltransferase
VSLADLGGLSTLTRTRSRTLRDRLAASGYELREPIAIETSVLAMEELRLPLIRRELSRDESAAATLALVFLHGGSAVGPRIDRAVGADARQWLLEAGILAANGSELRARFRLQVAEGIWIFCDEPAAGGATVMPPGPTTVDLLAVMPTELDGSVVDIGTGPGTIALVAAKRGGHAVATDINPRAAELARFNARFNELDVDVRTGDLFEPLRGERFRWLFAQPPYVARPSEQAAVTFLHGGTEGDELAMRIVAGIPSVLRPGGVAAVLFDAPVRAEPLHDRLRAAVGATGTDVAALQAPGIHPDMQAIGYASLEDPTFGARYATAALRYREHLEEVGVAEVKHSLAVIRARERADVAGWTIGLPVPRLPVNWTELESFLDGLDAATLDDEALARASVRPREGMVLAIERPPGNDRSVARRAIRFARPTFAAERELSEAGAAIIDILAGDPSMERAIARFAEAMERSVDAVRPLVVSFVRECLARGLLVPA